MIGETVQFIGLSDYDRASMTPLAELAEGDHVELLVRRGDGQTQTLPLPPAAARIVTDLISRLCDAERIALLRKEQELSPSEASVLLGISRPLVVHRMEIGDLPFRYVGTHRRAALKDVLALKARLDVRQQALRALAEDAEDLIANHGL
jgi:hypothetical protein